MTTGPRIYKSGGFLWLVFDQSPRTDKAHSVSFPINKKGLDLLVHILGERERSPFMPDEFMATKEAPIQYMVDKWLRDGNKVNMAKREAPETLTLEDLEL